MKLDITRFTGISTPSEFLDNKAELKSRLIQNNISQYRKPWLSAVGYDLIEVICNYPTLLTQDEWDTLTQDNWVLILATYPKFAFNCPVKFNRYNYDLIIGNYPDMDGIIQYED